MLFSLAKKVLGKNSGSSGGGVRSKISGSGYVVLNILRGCNIISLLAVAVASWIMLVMTVKTSNFFFFDGVSHFITSAISLFLIVSESGLFETYFEKYWPLFSPVNGFTSLGLAMIAVGFNILGNLNKEATSVQNLGLPLWREVIASGILTSVFGLFSMIAGFVFCDRKAGITSRQIRSPNSAARHRQFAENKLSGYNSSSVSRSSSHAARPVTPTLPSYNVATSPIQTRADETIEANPRRSRFSMKFPIRISRPTPQDPEQFAKWESRASPVAEGVQRPPTALHPAFGSSRRDYSPSRYSVVSNMRPF